MQLEVVITRHLDEVRRVVVSFSKICMVDLRVDWLLVDTRRVRDETMRVNSTIELRIVDLLVAIEQITLKHRASPRVERHEPVAGRELVGPSTRSIAHDERVLGCDVDERPIVEPDAPHVPAAVVASAPRDATRNDLPGHVVDRIDPVLFPVVVFSGQRLD